HQARHHLTRVRFPRAYFLGWVAGVVGGVGGRCGVDVADAGVQPFSSSFGGTARGGPAVLTSSTPRAKQACSWVEPVAWSARRARRARSLRSPSYCDPASRVESRGSARCSSAASPPCEWDGHQRPAPGSAAVWWGEG